MEKKYPVATSISRPTLRSLNFKNRSGRLVWVRDAVESEQLVGTSHEFRSGEERVNIVAFFPQVATFSLSMTY
jgi:hypothetical protein